MSGLSNYARNALLGHVFGAAGSAYTPAATVYLALCTADPTAAGTGASMNEVANSGNYARTAITFGAAASSQIAQSAQVNFPQLSGALGTATHYAVVDSATHGAGNMLAFGPLVEAKALNANNRPFVAAGQVVISLSGEYSQYLAHKLLDLMFRNQAYAQPSTYIFQSTATLTSTGSPTEPSGNGYARVLVNKPAGGTPAWGAVSGGAVSNADDVTFPTATGTWGTIVAGGIADATSGGNVLFFDNDLVDEAISTDDTRVFAAGNITATI